MSIEKSDVLGNLVYASASMSFASEIPGYNGTLFAISEETKERIEADLVAARAAVAELIEAGKQLLPRNLCLNNPRWPDSTEIPLTTTLGELRAFAAALANVGSAS